MRSHSEACLTKSKARSEQSIQQGGHRGVDTWTPFYEAVRTHPFSVLLRMCAGNYRESKLAAREPLVMSRHTSRMRR